MPSSYPGGFDVFSAPDPSDLRSAAPSLSTRIGGVYDALEAIQTALGLNPQSSFADVAARLADIEADVAAIPGGGGALTVRESDGSPSVGAVTALELDGGTITNQGNGIARYVPNLVAGSAGWWGSTVAVAASNARSAVKTAVAASGGYVCDGTNDDVEILAAIASLPSNVGGRVLLSEGNFNISQTIVIEKPGTSLVGMGKAPPQGYGKRGGTRLRWTGAVSQNMIRVGFGGDSSNNTWVLLRDFGLDGNDIAGVVGIRWRSQWSQMENLSIYNCGSHGISAEGFSGSQLFDCTYRAITIKNCGGIGFNAQGFAGDGQMYDMVISSCTGGGVVNGGSSCQWNGCHFYGNGGIGFENPGGAARTKLIGTKIEHSGDGAILWHGSQGILMGCSLQGNGQAGEYSARFTGDGNLIANNQIRQETGDSSASADTGLRFDAGSDSNLVVGCYFEGFSTKLSNAGSGNKVHGCFGVADLN